MILGVDPKIDYAFKYLFGREVNRPILIDVLDSVLQPPPGGHIRELELLNPFNPKESLDDKLSILDIKARDKTGRQFNIEMQMLASPAYDKRILYYASKLHQQQLHQGQDYGEMQPTISISFLNHVLFPGVADHHLHFGLLERTHHFAFSTDLAFHILELPKFKKQAEELGNGLDIWLYFLRYAEKMDTEVLPASLEQPLVKRALEELKMLTQEEIERERYEARLKVQFDHIHFTNARRKALQEAVQEGRQEGLQEGRQEGLQEGRQEGLQEGRQEGLQEGRQEGLQEGRQEGLQEGQIAEKIATVQSYERMLNRPETPTQQLASRSLEELTQLATDLLTDLLNRRATKS